jgi:peptidoglycan/xylan/chitin deacetylase (PgdA/CDA1 family)
MRVASAARSFSAGSRSIPCLEEIVRAGHEVGSHGHLHQRVFELTPESFTRDLEAGRAALAAAGVPHVRG